MLCLALASVPPAGAQGSVDGDRAALVAFYEALDGPNWREGTNRNWLSDEPLSEWFGVETNGAGRVTGLALIRVTTGGTIPPELGDLTELRELTLYTNGLEGSIPLELCRLSRLELVALGGNSLRGEIPACLGSLPLAFVDLSINGLEGELPSTFANLTGLRNLKASGNDLTGLIPDWLENLPSLKLLELGANRLHGTIPAAVGRLSYVDLSFNIDLTGPLPSSFAEGPVHDLDIHGTRICVPASGRFRDWAPAGRFDSSGLVCGGEPDRVPIIDLAFFYTRAAREAAGGVAEVEAEIDLLVAETNQIYVDSDVRQRIRLVLKEETSYVETGTLLLDLDTLASRTSLRELHRKRNVAGADLLYLFVGKGNACGVAFKAARAHNAAGVVLFGCDGRVLAHELGHSMGLSHDCLTDHGPGNFCRPSPRPHYSYGYGYVNQEAFGAGAPASARWITVMSYHTQCTLEGVSCDLPGLFSDPRKTYLGDPRGFPGVGLRSAPLQPANAVRALNEVRHSVASFRPSRRPDGEPPGPMPTGPCQADAATLCLRDARFKVRVEWTTADGQTGAAKAAAAMSSDTGLFWFFDQDNWEVLIKVLDGCDRNSRVWVFGASTTNLGYRIVVTDTMTGTVKEYRNEVGSPAPAITDTRAFRGSCESI